MKNSKKLMVLVFIFAVMFSLASAGVAEASTISDDNPFAALLKEIISIIEGPILSSAVTISIVLTGLWIIFNPTGHGTIMALIRLVFGCAIAAKGSGYIIGVLKISFLI